VGGDGAGLYGWGGAANTPKSSIIGVGGSMGGTFFGNQHGGKDWIAGGERWGG